MHRFNARRRLPFTAEQLYDLAADVARYPAFLPHWRAARVVWRDGDAFESEQVVGLGPLGWRFRARAEGHRPDRLRIRSGDSPFRSLDIEWRFAPAGDGRSIVGFQARWAFRSVAIEALAGPAVEPAIAHALDAFHHRAGRLYGPGADGRDDAHRAPLAAQAD